MNAISVAARVEGDIVTMQRAEFERLLEMIEDAQDILSTDAVQRRLASGEEETVPAAFVDRMLAGETLTRLWREHRGLTIEALAQQVALSPAELARIEDNQREADLRELKALAEILRVSLDDLVR